MLWAICYHLYNFKNLKNTHGRVLLLDSATLLKVKLFHGCFSRFLNCGNSTKSRNASQCSRTFFVGTSHRSPKHLCQKQRKYELLLNI